MYLFHIGTRSSVFVDAQYSDAVKDRKLGKGHEQCRHQVDGKVNGVVLGVECCNKKPVKRV